VSYTSLAVGLSTAFISSNGSTDFDVSWSPTTEASTSGVSDGSVYITGLDEGTLLFAWTDSLVSKAYSATFAVRFRFQ
jgi:hypothetical protein